MGDIQNVRQSYSVREWTIREEYYKNEIGKMSIATQPTSTDIKRLTAEIDSLLAEALLDMANAERTYESYTMKLKNAKEEMFIIIKQSSQQKLTEAEVKSLIIRELQDKPLQGDSISIFKLYGIAEFRFIYMKRIVEILKEKKAALVTDNGMLKLEAGIQ